MNFLDVLWRGTVLLSPVWLPYLCFSLIDWFFRKACVRCNYREKRQEANFCPKCGTGLPTRETVPQPAQ